MTTCLRVSLPSLFPLTPSTNTLAHPPRSKFSCPPQIPPRIPATPALAHLPGPRSLPPKHLRRHGRAVHLDPAPARGRQVRLRERRRAVEPRANPRDDPAQRHQPVREPQRREPCESRGREAVARAARWHKYRVQEEVPEVCEVELGGGLGYGRKGGGYHTWWVILFPVGWMG